ncbi:hypothetical protein TNCT_424962 [Trichonephila clavata]|uniref:Uncharacterized protein n=1 Tax=Trichonephila clavata TaxID=2740835 RepID=A0A8X6JYM4_TRICU|nr:hypothetical protein TNCT_424962 [Trichonephila clavata]
MSEVEGKKTEKETSDSLMSEVEGGKTEKETSDSIMSEVEGEKTVKETSDSLMSKANEKKGEKIGEEASNMSLMFEENEEGCEETGDETYEPLSELQCRFEEIFLTLSGGKTTFLELIRRTEDEMDERTRHDLAILVFFAKHGKVKLKCYQNLQSLNQIFVFLLYPWNNYDSFEKGPFTVRENVVPMNKRKMEKVYYRMML